MTVTCKVEGERYNEPPSKMEALADSQRGESSRDWEEVASALLEDGLVLTALELHAELLEAGKELSSLRDYFSNPGNFESAFPQPPTALLGSDLGTWEITDCTHSLYLHVFLQTCIIHTCIYMYMYMYT